MKKIVIATLALITASTAFSANWVKIGTRKNTDIPGSTTYIDSQSVKKSNVEGKTVVSFTEKTVYNQTRKTIEGNPYNYVIAEWQSDCVAQEIQITGTSFYNNKGKVVSDNHQLGFGWDEITPGTMNAIKYKAACQLAGY